MISTFKLGYLPWHAINKLRFLFNTILRCNNEKVESIQIFLSIFVFILYFITISYSLTLSYLLFSLSCLQLYELSDDAKRKDFLDDLFAFMQKRGKNKSFLHNKEFSAVWYWFMLHEFTYSIIGNKSSYQKYKRTISRYWWYNVFHDLTIVSQIC